jgi:hypothetical protein
VGDVAFEHLNRSKDLPAAQVSDLEKTVSHVADLIFLCEQALQMIETIAEKAEKINTHSLGNFFGPVQYAFFDTLALDTFKIFEQSAKYKRYSMPAVIKLLRASDLKQQEPLVHAIVKYGLPAPRPSPKTELLRVYIDETNKRLRSGDIRCRLDTLEQVRNKLVAHRQANVKVDRSLNVGDTRHLLKFAKNFISTVGLSFLSTIYSDDEGRFVLDGDAGRASRAAKRILEHMGIVALEQHDEIRARMLARTIQEAEWSETVRERLKELSFPPETQRR